MRNDTTHPDDNGARIVARFKTDAGELKGAMGAIMPGVTLGGQWRKRWLLGLGFGAGAACAVAAPFWPAGWSGPVSTALLAFALGVLAALVIMSRLGQRQQRQIARLSRDETGEEVVVSCGRSGIIWSTPVLSHSLSFSGVDAVVEHADLLVIRHKMFLLYVPARGFAAAADRAHLIDMLRQHVAAPALAGWAAAQG